MYNTFKIYPNSRFKKCLIAFAIVIVSLILLAGIAITIILITTPDYPVLTNSINDYSAKGYYFDNRIFMPTLPENAEVISYYSYNHWNEDYDQYLELKFNTKEEMEEYLNVLFDYSQSYIEQVGFQMCPENNDWFVRETNPYNSSFVDCYSKAEHYWRGEQAYTGYRVDDYIRCRYNVISYSYDCLTVIQSSCEGGFERKDNKNYTPKFLERFGITYGSVSHEIAIEFDFSNKDK